MKLADPESIEQQFRDLLQKCEGLEADAAILSAPASSEADVFADNHAQPSEPAEA